MPLLYIFFYLSRSFCFASRLPISSISCVSSFNPALLFSVLCAWLLAVLLDVFAVFAVFTVSSLAAWYIAAALPCTAIASFAPSFKSSLLYTISIKINITRALHELNVYGMIIQVKFEEG